MTSRYRSWILAVATVAFVAVGAGNALAWDGVSGEAPDAEPAPLDVELFGPIVLLYDARAIAGDSVRVGFDDAVHLDAVNERYVLQGVHFERDDLQDVLAYDFCACGNDTSSRPNVACTSKGPGSRWIANQLDVRFDQDTYTVGFTLGNDTVRSMVFAVELFDGDDRLIGSFPVVGNCNGACDEFVGVSSAEPFRRVRISHNIPRRAVCVDDVVFSSRRMVMR